MMMHDPYAHPHPHPHPPRFEIGSKSGRRSRTNFASCLVATVFLLFLLVGGFVVYIMLFKPKPPTIAIDSVQFPNFSISNDGTLNFTFFQFVTVTNPNRDEFTHYDSSMQLQVSSGKPVGLVFIPAGKIGGGLAQHMSAKFDVASYHLPLPTTMTPMEGAGVGPTMISGAGTMEIETRMKLVGKVRVLKVFTHKVETGARCAVVIELIRATVLGYHC